MVGRPLQHPENRQCYRQSTPGTDLAPRPQRAPRPAGLFSDIYPEEPRTCFLTDLPAVSPRQRRDGPPARGLTRTAPSTRGRRSTAELGRRWPRLPLPTSFPRLPPQLPPRDTPKRCPPTTSKARWGWNPPSGLGAGGLPRRSPSGDGLRDRCGGCRERTRQGAETSARERRRRRAAPPTAAEDESPPRTHEQAPAEHGVCAPHPSVPRGEHRSVLCGEQYREGACQESLHSVSLRERLVLGGREAPAGSGSGGLRHLRACGPLPSGDGKDRTGPPAFRSSSRPLLCGREGETDRPALSWRSRQCRFALPSPEAAERGAWLLGHVPWAGPGRRREGKRGGGRCAHAWGGSGGARCGAACRRHHAAEAERAADQRLVHHRQSRDRRRVLGRGGAGRCPVQLPAPPARPPRLTGAVGGCGVSAVRWASALGGGETLLTAGLRGCLWGHWWPPFPCVCGPGCLDVSPGSGLPLWLSALCGWGAVLNALAGVGCCSLGVDRCVFLWV